MNITDFIIPAMALVFAFFAGWKCAVAWHSRKPATPPPTPMQRAICSTHGRERRNTVSHMLQASHANGFVQGQLSNR